MNAHKIRPRYDNLATIIDLFGPDNTIGNIPFSDIDAEAFQMAAGATHQVSWRLIGCNEERTVNELIPEVHRERAMLNAGGFIGPAVVCSEILPGLALYRPMPAKQ